MLLVIGQIFLVGAIMQTDSTVYHDVSDSEEQACSYEMLPSARASAERAIEFLGEDQMPEPALAEAKALPATSLPALPKVTDITFRSEPAHDLIEFAIDAPVKIVKRNQGGKILRIRIIPAIKDLSDDQNAVLKKKFEKFSMHQTAHYTEMVMSARGRIGSPYTAADDTSIFRLTIPYQTEMARFALKSGEKVASGVTYYRDRAKVGNGNSDVHILRIEPFSDSIRVLPVLANEGIAQKEVLSSMARRYNAVAAINGAYFTSRGDPIGTLIINRRLISSPLYKRSVFGVTNEDTLIFGNPDFSGKLRSGSLSLNIDAVNQPRKGNQLVVYTPEYSRSTLTPDQGLELVLVKGKIVGIHRNDALIPPDGVVVSAAGDKAEQLAALRLGQSVELDYSIDKPWDSIRHAVCGGPRLLENGRTSINGKEEKFDNSIINGRHPRTAVAITFDGDLLFIVVDGRSKRNAGMKLDELATYLRILGARHAINLDGGGSSSMIIKGKTVNSPSDGGERRISNGILITNRK